MKTEQKVDELFLAALELEPDAREAFLSEACANNSILRSEVESLLASHNQAEAESFIEDAPFHLSAELRAGERVAPVEGQRVGAYKIIREIGRGGMGVVYLATRADDQYRKRVAIKLVKRGLDTADILRRFRHERQILASLDHPNIARLIDAGTTDDGLPYFVMDYVEGLSLHEYCDKHTLSTDERLKLFRTICDAVHYAHQNLVVHRDLKPGNILITEQGVPKLLDFGVAKFLNPELSGQTIEPTATALRVMTPEYASPEQVRGETITTASDVYSLGVILYELLTGHRPYRFKSHRPDEIARVICEEEPERPSTAISRVEEIPGVEGKPPVTLTPESVSSARDGQPETLRRNLSGDMDHIILMAMRKEPSRRYSSVAQLSEDIRRHLEGQPVIARRDTFSYRSAKFVRRHKAGVAAAMLIALSLVAGIIATVWQARNAALERDKARIAQAKAERINAFLQETLGFANPSWESPSLQAGKDATISEVLDEAAQRVESELADQPEVNAELRRTIGNAYTGQGRYAAAEKHLLAALDIHRKFYGEEHPETARSMRTLAVLLLTKGDYAGAEPLYRKALPVYRRGLVEGSIDLPQFLRILNELGMLLERKGETQKAESFLHEGLELSRVLSGRERVLVALMLNNLGLVRERQANMNEAEVLYRQAIEEFHRLPGRKRAELAYSLSNLGDILKTKHQYAEAERLVREGLDVVQMLYGQTNPVIINSLQSHVHLLYLTGDYEKAEAEIRKALALQRQTLPTGHLSFATSLALLGMIETQKGQLALAESHLRESLAIRRRDLPKGHWLLSLSQAALGECLTAQKRYAEAEQLLLESYNGIKASMGEQNWWTGEVLKRVVRLYEAWGKPDAAARFRALLAGF